MVLECEVTLTMTCDEPGCVRRSSERIIQGAVEGMDMPSISAVTFTDDGWGLLRDKWYCPDHLQAEWARMRRDHPLDVGFEQVRRGRHRRQ